MARHVDLLTTNPKKAAEWRSRLSLYGIRVHMWDLETPKEALLSHPKCLGVLREESNLYDPQTGETLDGPFEDLSVALNTTTLEVKTRDDVSFYRSDVKGFLDLDRKQEGDVFGWDDIFVPAKTQMSYHEMRQRGLKLSARDRVISQFLMEHVWYSKQVNLNWFPQDITQSVDFGLSPVEFVEEHKYYSQLSGVPRYLLNGVLASGLFLRSAKNRREKIYWLPGLNAGIPFTPKRDDFHESTFMMHDFMHFAFPDLIFDGAVEDKHRKTYIMHRMMSEAFTLVLGDMVFVDFFKQRGLDYDFSKRRLYPLYEEASTKDLKTLLKANARYCLLGDLTSWTDLGVSQETFDHFRDKFEQFFVSDYLWTAKNFDNMSSKSGSIRKWLDSLGDLPQEVGVPFAKVSSFTREWERQQIDFDDTEALFEAIFATYYQRLLDLADLGRSADNLHRKCLTKGFRRYMMGQVAIFSRFDFLPESRVYRDKILGNLKKDLDLKRVRKIRSFFAQYLSLLEDKGFISQSDRETYKQVYPLFDPFYVGYDTKTGETISQVRSLLLEDTK